MTAARSIGACFEEVAGRHAGKTALGGDVELSYAALDARADRVARIVHALGGGAGSHVALLFDQGAAAIAAILGVVEAGRAWVPLDPTDPPARLRFVLEDSAACVLLTDARHAALARRLAGRRCAVVDVDDGAPEAGAAYRGPAVSPDTAACLLYTSGSTGRPKGVIQTHRSLLHFVRSYAEGLRITAADRVSLLYTLAFGAANMDVFGALLHGATLCPYDVRRHGTVHLAAWLRAQGITVLHAVPTLFRHVLRDSDGRLDAIRVVNLGGEPVYPSDVALGRGRLGPDCVVVNHFAATEASVIAQHAVRAEGDDREQALPVGRPAPGIEVRVVRDDGSDAADDEVGEIVVRSPFLGPGYWHRPELTRAAFGEEPGRPGWRTYRTGDLGRRDAGGLLRVVGRRDARLKLRGHSVDVGEVEAALRGLPAVREAAVVPVAGGNGAPGTTRPGTTRMVAWVVAPGADRIALRRALAAELPGWMLPARIALCDALPTTATGKVDRRALASTPLPPSANGSPYLAPRTATERQMARLWEEALGAWVGVRDDFFELGGDSLAAARLLADVLEVFGANLPLAALVEAPTVEELAGRLAPGGRDGGWPVAVPLRAGGGKPPFFCVPGAGSDAFSLVHLARRADRDRPFFALQARGTDGIAEPHARVEDVAAEFVAAVRGRQPVGPYALGGASFGGLIAWEMAQQLRAAGERVAALVLIDAYGPGYPRLRPWRALGRPLHPLLRGILPLGRREELTRANLRLGVAQWRERLHARWRIRRGRRPVILSHLERYIYLVEMHFHAGRRYRPRPYPGRVVLLRAAEQPRTMHYREDPTLGWGPLATGPLEVREVPGRHGAQLLEPDVRPLARVLQATLERERTDT